MKLHLPKQLSALVVIAAIAQTVNAEDYNVGLHTGGDNAPSSSANYWTPSTGADLTLSGTGEEADWLGAKDANGNKITSFGTQSWKKEGGFIGIGGTWKDSTGGNVTKNAKFGTLTIKEEAQVVLGGQYKTETGFLNMGSIAEYTGVIADKVVVEGGFEAGADGKVDKLNLNTWNLSVNTLEVNSGTVAVHNKVQSGNNFFVYQDYDSKQARIKQALNINGGTTVFNLNSLDANNGKDDTHVFTGFGSINFVNPKSSSGVVTDADSAEIVKSLITQTAGTLTVNGKTASVGGLNINQSGGTMNISTAGDKNHSWHILSDFGDSSIVQSGDDAVLNIGGIAAYNSNYKTVLKVLQEKGVVYDPAKGELESEGKMVEINPSVAITQTGKGEINIIKGIDLNNYHNDAAGVASTEKSTITQSGGGSINLQGDYLGATYDIVQKENGGTIALHGSMTADSVQQSGSKSMLELKETASLSATNLVVTGKVDNKGSMDVENLEVQGGGMTNQKDAVIVADSIAINGGVFTNYGVINGAQAPLALRAISSDTTAIVVNSGQFVNYGTTTQEIVVNGGVLTLGAGSDVAGVTMDSGTININGNTSVDSLTLNGGIINFGGDFVLDLNGGDVLLSDTVSITLKVDSLAEITGDYTLFENVGAESAGTQRFQVTFVDAANNMQSGKINYSDGKITATIPEPTTTTLSLLALAALVVRRRR
ncbi:MAG: hypothetical protein IJO34_03075 [Akkermansia sp.]|nr:hypothetical protein [Akkermansia sp.]